MNSYILASHRAPDTAISRDFIVACVWSACGLALTGLFYAVGLGAEIAQALAAAG